MSWAIVRLEGPNVTNDSEFEWPKSTKWEQIEPCVHTLQICFEARWDNPGRRRLVIVKRGLKVREQAASSRINTGPDRGNTVQKGSCAFVENMDLCRKCEQKIRWFPEKKGNIHWLLKWLQKIELVFHYLDLKQSGHFWEKESKVLNLFRL